MRFLLPRNLNKITELTEVIFNRENIKYISYPVNNKDIKRDKFGEYLYIVKDDISGYTDMSLYYKPDNMKDIVSTGYNITDFNDDNNVSYTPKVITYIERPLYC